jgi:uncharacterized protein YodC (DUF2158 family)
MEFKIGEVVRRTAGGPKMNIDAITEPGRYRCSWIDKDRKLQDGVFPGESLERVVKKDLPTSYLSEPRRRWGR